MFAKKVHSKLEADLNPQPGDIGLTCSCSACDSIACFARRQLRKNCHCDECPPPDRGLGQMLKASVHSIIEKISTELLKNEVTYDYEKIENKLEKTDNVVEKRSQNLFGAGMVPEKDELVKTGSNKSSCPKSAAQLSAQIMNVPYEHLEASYKKSQPLLNLTTLSPFDIFKKIKDVYKACSCKVCDCIVATTQKNEFCKCKPCDCDDCKSHNINDKVIVQSANKDDNNACAFTRCDRPYFCRAVSKLSPAECDCGPCECIKCVNELSAPCNCEPCQCIECRTRNVKLMPGKRTMIVASVGEDYQARRPCDCVPCECIQCSRGISTTTPPILHEMSTGLDRHPHCRCDTCANDSCLPDGTNTCRCERRNKIVRKPVTNDNTDYDIRSAIIHQNLMQVASKGRDTITMFAAVNNVFSKNNTGKCKCEECECLKCSYKQNSVKFSKVSKNSSGTIKHSKKKCKCTTYEKICPKKSRKESPLQYHTESKWCKCDMCVCLNCNNIPKPSSRTGFKTEICAQSDKVECTCTPCECTDCQREMNRCSDDVCQCAYCKCNNCIDSNMSGANPVKKGKIQILENGEPQLRDFFLETSIDFPPDDRCYYDSEHKSSIKKHSELDSIIETVKQKLLDVQQSEDITANIRRINKGAMDLRKCLSQISAYSSASYYMREDSGSLSPLPGRRNKSWESSCNSSGYDYPNYLVKFPKNAEKSCVNDVIQINLQNNYSPDEFNISTNMNKTKKPINISPNFWEYENTSSRKGNFKSENKDKLSYDECSSVANITYLELTKIPNQTRSSINSNYNKEDSKIMSTGQIENSNNKRKEDRSRLIDYNRYFEDTKKEFYNDIYQNRDQHIITKEFSLDEDYERAQKTLEDAREFSQHLKGLLEKYEKANRDFESVSQKFKHLTSCIHNTPVHDIEQNNIIIPELQSKILEATVSNLDNKVPTKQNMCDDNFKAYVETNNNKGNSGDEAIVKFKKDKVKYLSKQKYYDYGYSDNELRLNYENSLNPIMEEKETSPERCSIKQRNKRTKLTYNKMYKRAVNVTIKPKILPNTCVSTETSKVLVLQEKTIDDEYNKQGQEKAYNLNSLENADVDAIIEKLITDRHKTVTDIFRPMKDHKVSEDKIIHLLKPPGEIKQTKCVDNLQSPKLKNNNDCMKEQEGRMKEIDTRRSHVVRNKSRTLTWESEKQGNDNVHGNNTLINLHLVMKQQQNPANCPSRKNSEKIKEVSNSLDNLKVSHLRTRKLSDHTVEIKWHSPAALQYVDGYEILLDGRTVKKIHSASNCTAVVQCLPNFAQLLLTVKTITNCKIGVYHTPTSTIIYRPNECNGFRCHV